MRRSQLLRRSLGAVVVVAVAGAGLWFAADNDWFAEDLAVVELSARDTATATIATLTTDFTAEGSIGYASDVAAHVNAPPPTLEVFDAPSREVCTVLRGETNTPLQALALMNDPTFVEASRVLAQRLLRETSDIEQRINTIFHRLLGRDPNKRDATS